MDMELRNRYEPIVRQYRLDTQHMEEHGSVTKIYTNQGPYALKKIEGRKLERNNFLHHIQYLKEKGFSNYVPIYHATDGNYILSDGTYNYYLMPWLERAEGTARIMINTIKCFRLSERCIKNGKRRNVYRRGFRKHYTNISDRWESDGEMLEEFCRIGSEVVYVSV